MGERTNIVNKEGNQPIPLDEPKPNIDQISTPHTEDATEVRIHKPNEDDLTISNGIQMPMAQPKEQGEYRGKVARSESGEGEGEDKINCEIVTMDERLKGVDEDREIMEGTTRKHPKEQPKVNSNGEGRHKVYPGTTDDAKSIWHLRTDQISAKLVLKLTELGFPDFESVHLNSTISDERIGGEESEGVDDDNDEADWATSTTTAISETKGQREVNPKERDDAKSNPLPPIQDRLEFDDAELILMQMDLNATPLKSQHPCSLAKTTKVENLPYRKGIEPPIYAPMGSNSKTPPTIMIIDGILEEPPQISSDQSRGGGEASWINPRKNREGPTTIATQFYDPRIVNIDATFMIEINTLTAEIFAKNLEDPGGMHLNMTKHVFRHLNDKVLVTDFKRADRTANLGTVKHPCDNPIPVRSNFDSTEAVSTLIDPDALLPKVQYPATIVNIEQNKDLPYHDAYGFNTHAPNGTSPDVALATPTPTQFLEDMGALRTEVIKRVFQPTKG